MILALFVPLQEVFSFNSKWFYFFSFNGKELKKSLWVPPQSFTHTGKWTGQSWGMTTSCFGMSLSFLGKMMAFNLDGLPHQDKGLNLCSHWEINGRSLTHTHSLHHSTLRFAIWDLRFQTWSENSENEMGIEKTLDNFMISSQQRRESYLVVFHWAKILE